MLDDYILFSGTANPGLAASIARHLGTKLGSCAVERFPDGELTVKLNEPVRRKEVFIVQPTSPPVNDNLVELLAFADACRRSSARRVTAIVPYFGYARSDKRHGRREPITARVVADLFEAVEIDHVITVDLHASQIEGFFHTPVDSLTAVPTLCDALAGRIGRDAVVISPDAGRVRMATEYAHRLGTSVVVLHKQRESGVETKVTHIVGEVRDKACLIIDDMISTGGTIAEAVGALLEEGARPEMIVAATHCLFLEEARNRLSHEAIREVFVTDTVSAKGEVWPRINIVSIAPLIAGAISRFVIDGSLSDLY